VGNPSKRVRDKLWEKAYEKRKDGYILQIWSDGSCPQGYRYRSEGQSDRQMIDFEGIALVRRLPKRRDAKQDDEKEETSLQ
jgi:hypothetical protein